MATDEQITALSDRFHAAAVGTDTWTGALEALATVTRSRGGQIIGLGSDRTVPFNWITNYDPEAVEEFALIGGGDPGINPRIRAGFDAPELVVLSDSDYITPEDLRTPIFADYYTRWDIPFICHTNLVKRPDLVIGFSLNRTARQGHIDDEQRRIFTAVAPHVRAAVRTQMALEGQGAALIAGALEALSLAVFVCDRDARVLARSPLTEELLKGDGPLRLLGERLAARRRDQLDWLAAAIAAAARGKAPALTGVAFASADGAAPVVLDVVPMPARAHGFSLEARVLVVARLSRRDTAARAALVQTAFAVTTAESEIAVAMLDGRSPEAIAAARGASIHTVRTQIKTLYAKLGVSDRAAFAAKLEGLN